ncbi:flagellar protein FlgN [Bacillus spongiae]|uniref:Flagellar protein FlgN n=1 Tax=Bacillus spongiae TaxID=2683610 RepID=A0ABU8HE25_9BACI
MSFQSLLTSLNHLTKLHRSLFELSVRKTDVVKEGNIDQLNELLKNEQKYLAAVQTVDKQRQQAVVSFLEEKGGTLLNTPTIKECVEYGNEIEKEQLLAEHEQLVYQMEQLKERNDLNQQLIYQSLQFVNLNISMLQPQTETVTYSRPNQPKQKHVNRSLFDSQA